MSKFEPNQKVQLIDDRDGYGRGVVTLVRTNFGTARVFYWVEFERFEGWFPEDSLQEYGLGIRHYIGPKGYAVTSSTFVCGAYAVGARSTRMDTDPLVTTCRSCKQTPAWQEAYAATR